MSGQKQDLRVVRTHALIKNALIELLKNNEFEKISVQDIVEKAMINRATFYKYYSGKSDLAGAMIDEFKQHYQHLLNERFQEKPTDIQVLMNSAIPALYEKRTLILALWKIKTRRHHLYDDMFLMIKNRFIRQQQPHFPKHNLDYQGEIMATIALKTAQYYFEQDLPIPIKQAWADIEMVLKSVQAA